ncbi:MAG: NUDIX hydrolase [Burkholderiaceae bacterium]
MKFCSECACPVSLQVPPDDNRERFVCENCGVVHYENPKLVIGTIPVWDDGDQPCVLLCRRAIEPRHGYWTLPAGFMENGETTSEGAARETLEEAGARIELHELFSMLNVPSIHQVHLFYRATLLDLDYAAGTESLEVRLFSESDIPWSEIAFQTVSQTLRYFFEDHVRVREGAAYRLHLHDIGKPARAESLRA